MYQEGWGQKRDLALAAGWFTRAADQGNAIAQRLLAGLYAAGDRRREERCRSNEWYTRAAEGGDSAAQVELAFRYTRGWGVPMDDAEAVKWLHRAAVQGSADAFIRLPVYDTNMAEASRRRRSSRRGATLARPPRGGRLSACVTWATCIYSG